MHIIILFTITGRVKTKIECSHKVRRCILSSKSKIKVRARENRAFAL
jgi:hypothetical protein